MVIVLFFFSKQSNCFEYILEFVWCPGKHLYLSGNQSPKCLSQKTLALFAESQKDLDFSNVIWEISTGKEKNLVFRWTQIYSQMNHKVSRSEGTLPREFLFLLMSCFCLCGSLLAYVPCWHPLRQTGEVAERFPYTMCMSFVFCDTLSCIFYLSCRKMHYCSYCSWPKYTCVCINIYTFVYTHIHICLYTSVYVYVNLNIFIYL